MALCTVTGTILDEGGQPLAPGAVVSVWASVPQAIPNTAVMADSPKSFTADINGVVTFAAQRGTVARIRCTEAGLDQLPIGIPDTSTADLATLVASSITTPPSPLQPFALESDLLAEVARAEGAEGDIVDDLTAETNAREAADTVLADAITTETTNRATAVTNEATARASADTTLQSNISSEATTRSNADTSLGTAITNEVTRAEAAEAALALILSWLHVTADKTIEISPPASTFSFLNTIVRAYQFNLNGHILMGSDSADSASFSDPSDGTKSLQIDISTARKTVLRDVDGNMSQVGLGGLDLNSLTGFQPYQWGPNPAFHGIRVNTPNGSFAIIGAGDGTAYFWDPVNNTSGTANSDNFANQARTFLVDPSGNALVSTLKLGGSGAVAISESPAGVIQATAGDLSTPVTMRFKSITATATAPVTATPGIEGEIRLDGSHIFRYTGGAWFEAPLTFTPV